MINKVLSPKTAKPATPKPITVPPRKDTFNACARLVRAACVVRTLALVAIFIPINPAAAEKKQPVTKDTTINKLLWSFTLSTCDKQPKPIPAMIT